MLKMIAVVLLLTSLVIVHTEAKDRCERGWEPFGYSCYYFSKNTLTWDEAAEIRNDHSAHLVRMNNRKELRYLLKKVKAIGQAHYTDGTDSCKEGKWIWDSTGEKVVHAEWYKGEPNDHLNKEDCMTIWTGSGSNDVSCSNKYRYICKKQAKVKIR